jgi:hypothetical protein
MFGDGSYASASYFLTSFLIYISFYLSCAFESISLLFFPSSLISYFQLFSLFLPLSFPLPLSSLFSMSLFLSYTVLLTFYLPSSLVLIVAGTYWWHPATSYRLEVVKNLISLLCLSSTHPKVTLTVLCTVAHHSVHRFPWTKLLLVRYWDRTDRDTFSFFILPFPSSFLVPITHHIHLFPCHVICYSLNSLFPTLPNSFLQSLLLICHLIFKLSLEL